MTEFCQVIEKMSGGKPKKTRTPVLAGEHPENNLSEFWDQDQIKQYQTIVVQLIWLSGLERFDIAVHIMTENVQVQTTT